jgi:hypothetical protein
MLRFFSIFVLIFMICFGVKGADISIDGPEKFEQLDISAGQKLKSISLKNLNINDQFWEKWNGLNFDLSDLICLSFDRCTFEEWETFAFLAGFSIQKLKMTNCSISDENLSDIMKFSYVYITEMIFSGNNLGKDKGQFYEALENFHAKGGGLSLLNLSDNHVISEIKSKEYAGMPNIIWE